MRKLIATVFLAGSLIGACAPKVQLVAPEKPIVINLNVRIDQEIRVKLDKDVEDLLADNPDIF